MTWATLKQQVEGRAFPADPPQVLEDLANGPVLFDGHVLGRHPPANRVLGIAEQGDRDLAFLGRQQAQQLLGGGGREFLEQGGAVIRLHLVQDARHLLVPEGQQEPFLGLEAEVLEDVRRQLLRQKAEQHRPILRDEVREDVGDVLG